MKALKIQELKDRIKTRRRLKGFYEGIQTVLRNAGCIAKTNYIQFSIEEQQEAERLWTEINHNLNSIRRLISMYEQKDKEELSSKGDTNE